MLESLKVILSTILIAFNLIHPINTVNLIKQSVKGASINKSVTPTEIQVIPTTTSSNTSIKLPQTKQYGAWYWRPDLGKAQIWIGTNSAGQDIYVDQLSPSPIVSISPSHNVIKDFTCKKQSDGSIIIGFPSCPQVRTPYPYAEGIHF